MTFRRAPCWLLAGALAFVAGCASRSAEVRAVPANASAYSAMPCEALYRELDAVGRRANGVAAAVDQRFANNAALVLVSGLVWPAALGLRGDGDQARELAVLKGQHEALREAVFAKRCAPPEVIADPAMASKLALQPGDRLVYEDVVHQKAVTVVEVSAIRADRVEMNSGAWTQDFSGNRLPIGSVLDAMGAQPSDASTTPEGGRIPPNPQPGSTRASGLPYVTGFLRTGLTLGQTLAGSLHLNDPDVAPIDISGEVLALGPASLDDGEVPTATIELQGRVAPETTDAASANVLLRGVLVVDSRNGNLVRLQLGAPRQAVHVDVRLMRVEPSAHTPSPDPVAPAMP
jgi:hypothetical protein